MRGTLLATLVVGVLLMYTAPALRSQTAQSQGPTSSAVTTVPGQIAPPAPGAPTQPAIAVTTVPSPASPQNPIDQVMWAGAVAYILDYLKKKPWFPVLSENTLPRIKAQIGFIAALLTAVGIHFAVNGSFFSHDGLQFSVAGLSFDAVKDVGFQWLSQQAWYDTIVHNKTV
jgi:hypothetical protein